ncbi:MAG: glycine zipper 2TM domain-containing protein [Proteobacteria bacterium]|nr:glycine zipper 2TM domain-containing protein [Pseudomonadota bacterium]
MNLRNALLAGGAALTLGACATTSPGYGYGNNNGYGNNGYGNGSYNQDGYNQGYCRDCGVVTRIDMGPGSSSSAPTGAIIGGIVGAVAGREIAGQNTKKQSNKNVATVAGAAAGALVGNAIQNRNQNQYNVTVRMDDGRFVTVSQSDVNGIQEGTPVRVTNGRAWAR